MPLFTRETAAINAAKANQVRWSRWRAQRDKAQAVAIPEPPKPQLPQLPQPADDFQQRRLARVREQLDRIDALMVDETDPKRLKEYAESSARLSAQEFDLSGRPKSGSLKPGSGLRAGRLSAWQVEARPLGIAPQVAQVEPVQPAADPPIP